MVTLTVRAEKAGPVFARHPWVFSRAFHTVPEGLTPGDPVRIVDDRGRYLASGYFGSYAQITVRLWGFEDGEEVDGRFFARRIARAYALRRRYVEGPGTDSYRLVSGESDLLPGLIVDKYAEYLAVQFHTRGMERWKEEVVKALESVVRPMGIYERSETAARTIEGLGPRSGLLAGTVPLRITIAENGIRFLVDIMGGQKTGFFLDQRDKRRAVMRYAKDAEVLNCFAYTGGFALSALAGGAKTVVNVDTSEPALDLARENVRLNGFDLSRCTFVSDDAKRFLRQPGKKYDLIILDPPAFIKDRRKKAEGVSGYRGINEAALRLLGEEGVLVTCSCSTHLAQEEFRHLLAEAAGHTGKSVRVLEAFTHGIDHPLLLPFQEGQYLKCLIVQDCGTPGATREGSGGGKYGQRDPAGDAEGLSRSPGIALTDGSNIW